jgi:hypothetical protein
LDVRFMKLGWRHPEMSHKLADKAEKTSSLDRNFIVV